jgi:hypothetical protein
MSTLVAEPEQLPGMPQPQRLRRVESDGTCVITLGRVVLFCFDTADTGMRHLAVVALTDALGWGRIGEVAEVFDVTPEHVSRLRARARQQGSAGLVRRRGRPAKLSARQVTEARVLAGQGVGKAEIARRYGVHPSQITRLLDRHGLLVAQGELDLDDHDAPTGQAASAPARAAVAADAAAGTGAADGSGPPATAGVGADRGAGAGQAEQPAATPAVPARIGAGGFASRYTGAMLLHAFFDRVDAAGVLGSVRGGTHRRDDDVALLTATSLAFALGASSLEGTKQLLRAQTGPLAGLRMLPELRTLRPRLAALADDADPLALQRDLARAMLAADAPALDLFFVDDHFVAYEGAKPVGKGWNTKRRHAQKGRADTLVTDYHGRAVCFVSGEPSGLATTLPPALAELRQITGQDAKIMLGFDRGGAYPSVFATCRQAGVDWLTYRRGRLEATSAEPTRFWVAHPDAGTQQVTLADETVHLNGYGPCRQLTLFEDGTAKLQVLTSDLTAPAAALLAWLRCRWRIENAFKYLTRHHGIDWLCDYTADLAADTTLVANPARTAAKATLKAAQDQLATAERAFAQLLGDHDRGVAAVNKAIPAAQTKITRAEQAVANATARLKKLPAKLPANQLDPTAQRARLRTRRRSLQMVLRLLAYNAELWLADHLNAYLRDTDEYRATTRNLLHLGGTITYTPQAVTVTLDQPATPRLTRALTLLADELNTTPPHLPGDPRPITYEIAQN